MVDANTRTYSLASRLLRRSEVGVALLWRAYTLTPYPLSRAVLALGRSRFLFPDNRLPSFRRVFSHIRTNNVPGDYLEFGVFRGQSFIMAYQLGHDEMRFFAFDSFEGLPKDEELWERGQYACTEDHFRRALRKAGVDLGRVLLVPGYYETLVPQRLAGLGKAAVIHIDCDLYSSTVEVFRIVDGMIGVGTVVIFDDWFSFSHEATSSEHGEQRAFYEWKEAHRFEPFLEVPPWHKSFVCVT